METDHTSHKVNSNSNWLILQRYWRLSMPASESVLRPKLLSPVILLRFQFDISNYYISLQRTDVHRWTTPTHSGWSRSASLRGDGMADDGTNWWHRRFNEWQPAERRRHISPPSSAVLSSKTATSHARPYRFWIDRKSYALYRTVTFPLTLRDRWRPFQNCCYFVCVAE